MKAIYIILFPLFLSFQGLQSQTRVDFEKSFDDEYFGYINKGDRKPIFPPIIKQSVGDFNQWGFAEINVNTEKLKKYKYNNPLEKYTQKKFRETISDYDYDNKYPHAWGVIDRYGKFLIEPRYARLKILTNIPGIKYGFFVQGISPGYKTPFLYNRTNGQLTELPFEFNPFKAQPVNSEYFFLDVYIREGGSLTGFYNRGLMRYDGKKLLDAKYANVQLINIRSKEYFLTKDKSDKTDVFCFTASGDSVENITQGRFSNITYVEGSEYFKVVENGVEKFMSANGVIKESSSIAGDIKAQQEADLIKRAKSGQLNDSEFNSFYHSVLVNYIAGLPKDLPEGYGVISVWSPVADRYFTINNGSFGTTGEGRSVKKSQYWAGCNANLQKEIPNLEQKSSTSLILVPYGTYKVAIQDMKFGTTKTYTSVTTYTAVVTAQSRCIQVRLD